MPSPLMRDLQGGGGRGLDRFRAAYRHRREPAPRRVAVGDAQQQERRLGVMLVAEAHQPLDVVELDRQRGAHRSTSTPARLRYTPGTRSRGS